MDFGTQSHFRTAVAVTLIVLLALTFSTIGASAAAIPQPPTVGPAGTGPDVQVPARVTTPVQFFGYNLGEDYKLTPWQTREVPGQGMRKGVVEYA